MPLSREFAAISVRNLVQLFELQQEATARFKPAKLEKTRV